VSIAPAAVVALVREFGPRPAAVVLATFVTMVRAVPSVVALVFVFFALPFVGITLAPFPAVAATLTCVQIAYLSEVFRGALAAVGRGQLDATCALGLGLLPTLVDVVGAQSLEAADLLQEHLDEEKGTDEIRTT
jgi:polar amino acid transport system permease protein